MSFSCCLGSYLKEEYQQRVAEQQAWTYQQQGACQSQVRVEGGGEPSKTMLPMGGRSLSKIIMFEQVSEESSPFLANLDLVELFLASTGAFITFTLFSQPLGQSPACQNHPLSSSTHSNVANQPYFLVYPKTDLEGRSSRGLVEITAPNSSG